MIISAPYQALYPFQSIAKTSSPFYHVASTPIQLINQPFTATKTFPQPQVRPQTTTLSSAPTQSLTQHNNNPFLTQIPEICWFVNSYIMNRGHTFTDNINWLLNFTDIVQPRRRTLTFSAALVHYSIFHMVSIHSVEIMLKLIAYCNKH